MSAITIFQAKQIVTMNPSNPAGTHIAVRDGMILGVGALDELTGWGPYALDDTFKDHVLVPGMIEAHAHILEGALSKFPYVGYFEHPQPDGSIAPGITTLHDLIAALKAEDAKLTDPAQPLMAQGFDPIYFPGERVSRKHLDEVSTTRPIALYHASGHLATINSAGLALSNITRDTKMAGVARFPDGEPNGELQESPAMSLAKFMLEALLAAVIGEDAIERLGKIARNAGVTTVTDMGGMMLIDPRAQAAWTRVVNDPAFPARAAVFNFAVMPGAQGDWNALAARLADIRAKDTSDKLLFPGVKFVGDGSIQGWTAVLNEPGYYTGTDQGQLMVVPEQLKDWLKPFHAAGISISMHCNGDKTADVFIEAVEQLLKESAWLDHRHTVQHAQLLTSAQMRKMSNLGMCANLFANHIWYWGDQHYTLTVGPERANRMEACATAKREGIHFSIHSDANVTPIGQLHNMWCAVNRVTPSGRVLGEYEKISPYDALYAVTVDAAYLLHMDHLLGSLEAGKWADMTVLEANPLEVDPMQIKNIGVWGTVLGGVKQPKPVV